MDILPHPLGSMNGIEYGVLQSQYSTRTDRLRSTYVLVGVTQGHTFQGSGFQMAESDTQPPPSPTKYQ